MKNSIIYSLLIMMFAHWSWGQDTRVATEGLKKSYMEKREGFEQETRKAMEEKDQKELNRILGILEQNSPNSFDYHLVKYINGNYDFSEEEHLLKAFEMRPTDPIVNREMFAYYHLKDDRAKTKKFAPVVLRQHPLLTKHYFKQLSKSHKAGYLLCSGEGDAFPFMALQDNGDVSMDIEVITLDFLQNETYEKKIQKQFGITESFKGNEKAFVSALVKKAGKQMKVSTTVSQSYLSGISSRIFLTGLVYELDVSDQEERLIAFWKEIKVEVMNVKLDNSRKHGVIQNYLPPLLTLYKMKCLAGEKEDELRKGILHLAKELKKLDQIEKIIASYEQDE